MAYVVLTPSPMRTVTTTSRPWTSAYYPWYVQGYTSWREATRRGNVGGLGPCRAMLMGPANVSGSYVVLAPQVISPLPMVSGSG